MTDALLRRPDELTTEWLTEVLRDAGAGDGSRVVGFEVAAIGTGQMSDSFRVALRWDGDGPQSVVLKVASSDANSRATGVGMGAYEREIRFYDEIAPLVRGPIAECHLAAYDAEEGWFTLLLEDVAPARQGDQIAGCSVEQASVAMRELARLHAPVWEDPEVAATPWLTQEAPMLDTSLVAAVLDGFYERYGNRLEPDHRALLDRFAPRIDEWYAGERRASSIQHSDYRLDNLLFGDPGSPRPLTVVDWQTVGWGAPLLDAAYFIGGGLPLAERRAHEQALLREYHATLGEHGVEDFAWEACWEDYRRHTFWGVVMAVAASMLVMRTERGDEMFMTSLARHSQQVLDLDAEELIGT